MTNEYSLESKEKYGVGTKHKTKECYEIEVVDKLEHQMRIVRFENGYEVKTDCSAIRRGTISNPYHPSVCGIGYFGVGEYKAGLNHKTTPEYATWNSMLRRCYDKKFQERQPTYKGAVVCEEWLNFQNFAKWYEENYPYHIEGIIFELDKDLLQQDIENKFYSPQTCVFLPNNINGFLTNKHSNNTSGYTGIHWRKKEKKWRVLISLFGEGNRKELGSFSTPELASEAYKQSRSEQAKKAKEYLRSLNYLPEEIIELIK